LDWNIYNTASPNVKRKIELTSTYSGKKGNIAQSGVAFNDFNNLHNQKDAQGARILLDSATYTQPISTFCKVTFSW